MTADSIIPTGLPTPRAEYRLASIGRVAGDCPECGKERFPTRKAARKAARKVRTVRLNAIQCGNFWHIGKLERPVIAGRVTRDGRPHPDQPTAGNPTAGAQINAMWSTTRQTA